VNGLLGFYKETCSGLWETIDEERDIQAKYRFDIKSNTLYIFFQGSVSATDWKINLEFFPPSPSFRIAGKRIWGHRGFVHSMRRVWGWTAGTIKKHYPAQVVFSGYSQGAAYAEITTVISAYKYGSLTFNGGPACYAFGGPPVWWFRKRTMRAAGICYRDIIRVEHRGDPVVLLPHLVLMRAIGKQLKIGKLLDYLPRFWETHFPRTYEKALEEQEINHIKENLG